MENLTETSLEELYDYVKLRNKWNKKTMKLTMFDINMLIQHIEDLEND